MQKKDVSLHILYSLLICKKAPSQKLMLFGSHGKEHATNVTTPQQVENGAEKPHSTHSRVAIVTAPSAARDRLLLYFKFWRTHAAKFGWQTQARITSRVPMPAGQAVLQ